MSTQPIVVADLTVMSRAEWLQERRKHLGASDCAAACGMDPWKSPLKLWAELSGKVEPEPAGEAAELGLKLEPVVAQLFEERSGVGALPSTKWLQHPTLNFLRATLDYYAIDPHVADGIYIPVECKTRSQFQAHEYENDGAPDKHLIQLAVQMAVCGAPYGYLATLIGGQTFVWKRVERDLDLEQLILSLLVKFWEHVQNGTKPALTASDNSFMGKLYPHSTNTVPVTFAPYALSVIERYRSAGAQIDQLKADRDEAAAELKSLLGSADTGLLGQYKVTWKDRERKAYTVAAGTYRHFDVREVKAKS